MRQFKGNPIPVKFIMPAYICSYLMNISCKWELRSAGNTRRHLLKDLLEDRGIADRFTSRWRTPAASLIVAPWPLIVAVWMLFWHKEVSSGANVAAAVMGLQGLRQEVRNRLCVSWTRSRCVLSHRVQHCYTTPALLRPLLALQHTTSGQGWSQCSGNPANILNRLEG